MNHDEIEKNSKIYELFPIPLFVTNIKNEVDFDEIDKLLNSQNSHSNWKINANKNFSSMENYIIHAILEKNSKLKNIIDEKLDHFKRKILGHNVDDFHLEITQSWLNFNESGTSHHRHSHPNSIVSGVLYLNSTPNTGRIFFHRTPNFNEIFFPVEERKKEYNKFNFEYFYINPENYDLILFPSSLEHSVDTNVSENDIRISLAFNTFYSGTLGSNHQLSELRVKVITPYSDIK